MSMIPGALPDGVGQAVRETAHWSPPELTAPTPEDGINSSLCHGFIFDFCGVEIERVTAAIRIDRYVSLHDCGTILHEGMVDGQIRGGFAQAVGAALYEEYAYGPDGAFLAGTFADYPLPSIHEVPEIEIHHLSTPSPLTPLGAKGVGEGNCMSTPVCIANAVADALAAVHGGVDLTLPITPARLAPFLAAEPAAPAGAARPAASGRGLSGRGAARVGASPRQVWDLLMDADALAAIVPGAHGVRKLSPTRFIADVTLGVGPVRGRYRVELGLSDLDPPHAARLTGSAHGTLGAGSGSGRVRLAPMPEGGTEISYDYEALLGGRLAAVGGRLLDGAAKIVIGQFFAALGRRAAGPAAAGWRARVARALGRRA